MFFDSHAHYDDKRYDEDRQELLSKMKENDISYILNVGADIESSKRSIKLAEKYDFIYASVGIHPHYVKDLKKEDIISLKNLAKKDKVVAIGEIGLDYYYDNSPRDKQKEWFKIQLELAKELKLPVIIHNRDAHKDIMDIIQTEDMSSIVGVFHCYSGSLEMAKIVINKGFYISIAGPVTFKNAVKFIDIIKSIPDDRLLIETDCPYLTPEPYRGKRNNSIYMKYTAEKIASIKDISVEELGEQTTRNTKKLFKIN